MAALAGVEPWRYTLRELLWMADARRAEAWDRVAWTCAHILKPYMTGKPNLEDFNPLRLIERDEAVKAAVGNGERKPLPKRLSNEETRERWAAVKAKLDEENRCLSEARAT